MSETESLPGVAAARPVTGRRRVVGMIVDLVTVAGTALLVWVPTSAVLLQTGAVARSDLRSSGIPTVITMIVAVILLGLVPLFGTGATLGQLTVRLRPLTESGRAPTVRARIVRAAVGSGGYVLLTSVGNLTHSAVTTVGLFWAAASVIVALRGDHRGLSGMIAGIRVIDSRQPMRAASAAQQWAAMPELRSLGVAVIIFAALLHVGVLALVDLVRAGGVLAVLSAAALILAGALAAVSAVLFLLYNGLIMMRREGRSLGNILALLLGLGFCALTAATVTALIADWSTLVAPLGITWALVAYLTFLFWAFTGYGLFYARRTPRPGAQAIIVLGSRVFGDRVPPLLASRLDRGKQVLESQLAGGGDPVLVCSGGKGAGEMVAEGDAMADYLLAVGVAPERIRRETASRTTEENLLRSRELLRAEGCDERIIVVTNEFHAFRAALITRQLHLTAQVVGAPTARYFLPSALLREFVAVLARKPWPHIVVIGVIIAAGVFSVA